MRECKQARLMVTRTLEEYSGADCLKVGGRNQGFVYNETAPAGKEYSMQCGVRGDPYHLLSFQATPSFTPKSKRTNSLGRLHVGRAVQLGSAVRSSHCVSI